MAVFLDLDFAGTAGDPPTGLTKHTLATGLMVNTDAGRIRNNDVNVAMYYSSAGDAPSSDYAVEIDYRRLSGNTGSAYGVAIRADTAALTFYSLRYNEASGGWTLIRSVAGALTTIGATVAQTLSAGVTYRLRIECAGTTVRGLVDGVNLWGDVTDANIAGPGRPGVRGGGGTTPTNSTAAHYDNLTAMTEVSPPVNTAPPVVSGTRVVGETLTTTDGDWTESPTSYSYQWKRDAANISGATSSTYVLVADDDAHVVSCAVVATNADGSSSPVSSNGLAIVAEITNSDVVFSLAAGGGLGGSPGATIPSSTSVFDSVTYSETVAGDIEYRAVYLKNTHAVRTVTDAKLWIESQTTSPTTDMAVGIAPEAAGSDVTAIANESTPPVGVTFSAPASEGTGLAAGVLAPGQSRGVWLRRTVIAGTAELPVDACTLAWSGTPA